MDKAKIARQQPVAWRIFSNALKQDRFSHAYLLAGPPDDCKKELALLVIQSLFCKNRDEDGFACQQCEICRRIENDQSLDFFWLKSDSPKSGNLTRTQIHQAFEGKDIKTEKRKAIYKEDIAKLQERFATSSRESVQQAFLLEDYDLATNQASNAFLKFLEEPKDNLFGLLLSQYPERILDTILSRVQLIQLKPPGIDEKLEEFERELDHHAKFLAMTGCSLEEAKKLMENERVVELLDFCREYASAVENWDHIFKLETHFFFNKSDLMDKPLIHLFLQKLLYDFKESPYPPKIQGLLMEKVIEAMDHLHRPYDLGLFMDDLYYQLLRAVL